MKKLNLLIPALISLISISSYQDIKNDNVSYHSFNMIKKASPSTSNTDIKPIITKVNNNYYFKLNKITVNGKEYTPYLYTIKDDGYYETGTDLTTNSQKIDKSSFEILYKYYPNTKVPEIEQYITKFIEIDESYYDKYYSDSYFTNPITVRDGQEYWTRQIKRKAVSFGTSYWIQESESTPITYNAYYFNRYHYRYGYYGSSPTLLSSDNNYKSTINSNEKLKEMFLEDTNEINKFYYKKEYTLDFSNYFSYKEASIKNKYSKVSKSNLYSWEQVAYDGLNNDSSNIEIKKYAFSTHEKAKQAVLESYTSIAKANEQISGNFSSTLDASGKYIYSYADISYIGQKNNIDKIYLFNEDNKYASNQNTDNIYVVKLPGNTYYSAFLKVWGEAYLKEVISRYIDNNITFEHCSFNTSLSKRYNEFEEDDVYDNTTLYGTELTLPSNTMILNDYKYNPFKITSRYLDSNNTIKSNNQGYTYSSDNISNIGFYNIDTDFYNVNKNTKAYVFNTNPEFSISSTNTTLNTKLHSSNTVYDVFKANETKELSFSYFDTCQIDVYKDDQYLETLYNKIDLSASNPALNPASYTLSSQGRYEFVLSDRLSQSKTWYVNISSSQPEVKINKADNKELELEINSSDGGLRNIDALYIYQKKVLRDENNSDQVKVLDNQNHASDASYLLNTSISASSKTNKFTFKPITEVDKVYYYNINVVVVDKYSQTTIITYAWNFVNDQSSFEEDPEISELKSEILHIGDIKTLSKSFTYEVDNDNAVIENNVLKAIKEGEFNLSIIDSDGNKKTVKYLNITPFETFVVDSDKEEKIQNNQKVEATAKFKLKLPKLATATVNGKEYHGEEISDPGEYQFVINRKTVFNGLEKDEINYLFLIIKSEKNNNPDNTNPNSDASSDATASTVGDNTDLPETTTGTDVVSRPDVPFKNIVWIAPLAVLGLAGVIIVIVLINKKIKKDKSLK